MRRSQKKICIFRVEPLKLHECMNLWNSDVNLDDSDERTQKPLVSQKSVILYFPYTIIGD